MPTERRMSGKAILVTGASSGIGAAIVVRLAKDGHRVVGTSRNENTLNPDGSEMLPLDVTSDASAHACMQRFLEREGRIDVLINNAGYLQSGAIEEVSIEQAQAQFEDAQRELRIGVAQELGHRHDVPVHRVSYTTVNGECLTRILT